MRLRQSKGRNDLKDLEGVLSVLDRCLYDGCYSGVVLNAGLRSEAAADLELGLGGPKSLFAVVVRGRDRRVCEEGEDVVPVFLDAFLEIVPMGQEWSEPSPGNLRMRPAVIRVQACRRI